MLKSIAIINPGITDAPLVQEILRLPDDAWSDIKIRFGLDEVATAEVTIILTGEQLKDLVDVAYKSNTLNACTSEDDDQLSLFSEEGT